VNLSLGLNYHSKALPQPPSRDTVPLKQKCGRLYWKTEILPPKQSDINCNENYKLYCMWIVNPTYCTVACPKFSNEQKLNSRNHFMSLKNEIYGKL
jgi:hypothetical protein